MLCPKCGKTIKDGSSICPLCDFILDKSFLGDDFVEEDTTDPHGQKIDEETPKPSSRPSPAGATPKPKERPSKEELAGEFNKVLADVSDTLRQVKTAYLDLERADRLSFLGAVVVFLSTFFPWILVRGRVTKIGLEVGGFTCFLLAIGIGTLIFFRRKKSHLRHVEKPFFYAQAACVGLTLFSVLERMFTVTAPKYGAYADEVAAIAGPQFQFGLFVCLLGSLATVVGLTLQYRKVFPKIKQPR